MHGSKISTEYFRFIYVQETLLAKKLKIPVLPPKDKIMNKEQINHMEKKNILVVQQIEKDTKGQKKVLATPKDAEWDHVFQLTLSYYDENKCLQHINNGFNSVNRNSYSQPLNECFELDRQQYKIIINLFYFMKKPSLIPGGQPDAVEKSIGMTLRQRKEHKLEEKQMQPSDAVQKQDIAPKNQPLTKGAQPKQGKRKACSQEEINEAVLSLNAVPQEIGYLYFPKIDAKGLLAQITNMANTRRCISLDLIRKKIKIEAKLLDELLLELEKHSLIRLGDKELYIFKEAEVEEQLRQIQQDRQDEIDQNEEAFNLTSAAMLKECMKMTNRKIRVRNVQLDSQHFLQLLTRRPLIRHLELFFNLRPRERPLFDSFIKAQEDLKLMENKLSIDCMLYMELNIQGLSRSGYQTIDTVFSCAKFYKNLKQLSLKFCTSFYKQNLERIHQFLIKVPQDFPRLKQFELTCELLHPFFHDTMQIFEENEQKAAREYPLSRVMVTFGEYSTFERHKKDSFALSSIWNSQFTYQLRLVDDKTIDHFLEKDERDINHFIKRRKRSIIALSIKISIKLYVHIEDLLEDISQNNGFRLLSIIHTLYVNDEFQGHTLLVDYSSKMFLLQIQTELSSSDHFRVLINWLTNHYEQFRKITFRITHFGTGKDDQDQKQIFTQIKEFLDYLPLNRLDTIELDLLGRKSSNWNMLPDMFRSIVTKCKSFKFGLLGQNRKFAEEISPCDLRDWIEQLCLLQHVESIEFELSFYLWALIPLELLQQILELMINANCKFQPKSKDLKYHQHPYDISRYNSHYINKLSKHNHTIVQRQKLLVMIGAQNETQRLFSDISSCKVQCEFIETVLGQYQI